MSFFFILFLCFTSSYANSEFEDDWSLLATVEMAPTKENINQLTRLGAELAGVDRDNKRIQVFFNEKEWFMASALFNNIEINYTKGVSRGPDEEYQNPEEIEALLIRFNTLYPELTQLKSIGKSLEGRDIWAIKISDNASTEEKDEPSILFNSMHHAREVMTPEVAIDIIEYLLKNYDSDNETRNWVDLNEIWIIPMVNVDGSAKVWSGHPLWRKNTRGGFGVDLNRNYPLTWNDCRGSSGRRSSDTYRGEFAGSEPETQAMMEFIKLTRPVFDISYHSFSEIVIYPHGCKKRRTQTKDFVEVHGKEIGNLLNYQAGTGWELLYNSDGGDIDWMYLQYQVVPYAIELNSMSSGGFHPRFSKWRDKTVVRNRAGWQYLLNQLQRNGHRGQLYIGDQLVKDYFIEISKLNGSNEELYLTYRSHEDGRFHFVAHPGQYRFNFKDFSGERIGEVDIEVSNQLMVEDIYL